MITLEGQSDAPRLTPDEVEAFARFAYMAHDHEGKTPSVPIFWVRTENNELWRFWN